MPRHHLAYLQLVHRGGVAQCVRRRHRSLATADSRLGLLDWAVELGLGNWDIDSMGCTQP